ncbi:hypothetical protein X777_04961 [Ooceraea biroi]|uniref:Uncharacterized protein n=1 Tax=Ooceraea biroi TaxID=2015173 RepID=A0A026WG89_OOCBI|nr:hypothetical protein X777_04961 [Ooceraea biroi]
MDRPTLQHQSFSTMDIIAAARISIVRSNLAEGTQYMGHVPLSRNRGGHGALDIDMHF